jgi:hypothetical protein
LKIAPVTVVLPEPEKVTPLSAADELMSRVPPKTMLRLASVLVMVRPPLLPDETVLLLVKVRVVALPLLAVNFKLFRV